MGMPKDFWSMLQYLLQIGDNFVSGMLHTYSPFEIYLLLVILGMVIGVVATSTGARLTLKTVLLEAPLLMVIVTEAICFMWGVPGLMATIYISVVKILTG